ncbi:MAG: stage II sporulation protein R, partial [Eubacterium sp.]|nr:stage II sporulation protein R [Eubacterium sp.]
MKIIKKILFGAAVLGVCVLMHFYGEATEAKERQEDIAKEVIRLHVVANSDLEIDQKLKLEVKEEIVTILRQKMQDDTSVAEAQATLRQQIPEIEELAENYIKKKGYSYSVKATLENCYFPIKEYGDMVFPA